MSVSPHVLKIKDHGGAPVGKHSRPRTVSWIDRLRASPDGGVYSTTASIGITSTSNNPIINE